MARRGSGSGGLGVPKWVWGLIAFLIFVGFIVFVWLVAGDQIIAAINATQGK